MIEDQSETSLLIPNTDGFDHKKAFDKPRGIQGQCSEDEKTQTL